jgi:hypothetical protein
MRKLKHTNLFHDHDKSEVYAALQRDLNRDSWYQAFWNAVIVGCAVGAAEISKHSDWLWIFAAIYAAERSLSWFIDNSNRNWFMHAIDWHESDRRPPSA